MSAEPPAHSSEVPVQDRRDSVSSNSSSSSRTRLNSWSRRRSSFLSWRNSLSAIREYGPVSICDFLFYLLFFNYIKFIKAYALRTLYVQKIYRTLIYNAKRRYMKCVDSYFSNLYYIIIKLHIMYIFLI
jgi:hypothetical protein